MSTIRIENLSKQFGAVPVLNEVNLEIDSGEFVVFVGPSGCGKSTL
ncbi:ATP-binding cassette domain-containing protein, partial [Devosia nitrariae]